MGRGGSGMGTGGSRIERLEGDWEGREQVGREGAGQEGGSGMGRGGSQVRGTRDRGVIEMQWVGRETGKMGRKGSEIS